MRDTERLTTNLGNLRNEIRYEVEKLTASQRLDLNLEKGRMRDELQVRSLFAWLHASWNNQAPNASGRLCDERAHAAFNSMARLPDAAVS